MLLPTTALVAALAISSSEHGRICREEVNARRVDAMIVDFRARNGREPGSIDELAEAGYLRLPPEPNRHRGVPFDRELKPLRLAVGPDGRARVVREGGAPLATDWDCNGETYVWRTIGVIVLLGGVARSIATRRWSFAAVAIVLVAIAVLVSRCPVVVA